LADVGRVSIVKVNIMINRCIPIFPMLLTTIKELRGKSWAEGL